MPRHCLACTLNSLGLDRMSNKEMTNAELERAIALMRAHAANTRSWANIAEEEDAEEAAEEARRNAALTPAQRAARNAARAKAVAAAARAQEAEMARKAAARTRLNKEMANRQAEVNAERAAKRAARGNNGRGSRRNNGRGSRRNNGPPPVHALFRGLAAAPPAVRGLPPPAVRGLPPPAVRGAAPAAAARLPAGKMARECKSSNVAHEHPTGGPCKFMHKDEEGFELLREDQRRDGPPKGGRRTRKRTTRRS